MKKQRCLLNEQELRQALINHLHFCSPLLDHNQTHYIFSVFSISMYSSKKITPKNVYQYTHALAELRRFGSQSLDGRETFEQEQKTHDKLFQIVMKIKTDRLRDLFISKLKRRVTTIPPPFKSLPQSTEKYHLIDPIEGCRIPEDFENLILILWIFAAAIMFILGTFGGFLDDFSQFYSTQTAVVAIKITCLIILVAQFILKCTNQTFDDGVDRKYLREILLYYIKSKKFYIDAISILLTVSSIILPRSMVLNGILCYFMVIVLIQASHVFVKLEIAYLRNEKQKLSWGLVKIILFNLLFAHFTGTVFLGMARINRHDNWIIKIGISDDQWYVLYIYACYWGITTMLTIGYGDILPVNTPEVIVTSFVQIFSCIVLAYNISQIDNIISKLRESQEVIEKKMTIFGRMVKNEYGVHVIDSLLERRIFNYIKELGIQKKYLEYTERMNFLDDLPTHLQNSYYRQSNVRLFPGVIFFESLKLSTLEMLAEKFRCKFQYPGEYLSQNHDEDHRYITILKEGEFGLAYDKPGSSLNGKIMDYIKITEKNRAALLTNSFLYLTKQNGYEFIASSYALIWEISYTKFFEVMLQSKNDYEHYFTIVHGHRFDDHEWGIKVCEMCEKRHSAFHCPRVTYMPLKSQAIIKYIMNAGKQQPRIPFIRERSKLCKISSYKNKKFFSKLIQKLAIVTSENNIIKEKEGDEYEIIKEVNIANNIYSFKHVALGEINEHRLRNLIRNAIQEYETGYVDGFWDLELDVAYNYLFYFPTDNAKKLIFTSTFFNPRKGKHNSHVVKIM